MLNWKKTTLPGLAGLVLIPLITSPAVAETVERKGPPLKRGPQPLEVRLQSMPAQARFCATALLEQQCSKPDNANPQSTCYILRTCIAACDQPAAGRGARRAPRPAAGNTQPAASCAAQHAQAVTRLQQ